MMRVNNLVLYTQVINNKIYMGVNQRQLTPKGKLKQLIFITITTPIRVQSI